MNLRVVIRPPGGFLGVQLTKTAIGSSFRWQSSAASRLCSASYPTEVPSETVSRGRVFGGVRVGSLGVAGTDCRRPRAARVAAGRALFSQLGAARPCRMRPELRPYGRRHPEDPVACAPVSGQGPQSASWVRWRRDPGRPLPRAPHQQGVRERGVGSTALASEPGAKVKRRQGIGGLLSYYHREAA